MHSRTQCCRVQLRVVLPCALVYREVLIPAVCRCIDSCGVQMYLILRCADVLIPAVCRCIVDSCGVQMYCCISCGVQFSLVAIKGDLLLHQIVVAASLVLHKPICLRAVCVSKSSDSTHRSSPNRRQYLCLYIIIGLLPNTSI